MILKSRAPAIASSFCSTRNFQTSTRSVTGTNKPTPNVEVVKRDESLTLEPSEASIREIEEEFDRDGQLPFEKLSGNWNQAGSMTAEYQICSKIELPYGAPGEDRRYGCMKTLKEQKLVVDIGEKDAERKRD